jgi:hypothetical protein
MLGIYKMITLKKHIVYTFLFIFVLTAVAGLSGIVGWVVIKPEVIKWVFGLLLAQCATVIVAIIKAPEYFSDPETITKLRETHLKEIEELQGKLTKSVQDRENMIAYMASKLYPDNSNSLL